MFLHKTVTKSTILILCGQMIKIVDALGHGDMIVTTEATESGLNGRSIHLPLISSAVKTAWENALDKGKDAGDAVTDEWTSFKDFWKDSMHIWIFLILIAVILAFMVCCCCCVPSTFCCACCPILTNLFALFKSNNDSKRNDRDWEDHRRTSRQGQIIYRKPKYRQELIMRSTDESTYETDREACYEKDRRRRRPLRNIPMTPVSTPSRSTIRNEKSISSVSSHENSHYSDPNRYTPKAGGQLYPNIP